MSKHLVIGQLAIVVAAMWTMPPVAAGQNAVQPRPGALVRVVGPPLGDRPSREIAFGRFERFDGDTAVISTGRSVMRVPLDSTNVLQTRVPGTNRNTGKGALIGAMVGGAIGLAAPCEDDDSVGFAPTCDALRPAAAVGLGLVGAGVGALIGHASRDSEWRSVQRQSRVSIVPQSFTRVSVRFSIRP